jgi:hypothetical protein
LRDVRLRFIVCERILGHRLGTLSVGDPGGETDADSREGSERHGRAAPADDPLTDERIPPPPMPTCGRSSTGAGGCSPASAAPQPRFPHRARDSRLGSRRRLPRTASFEPIILSPRP